MTLDTNDTLSTLLSEYQYYMKSCNKLLVCENVVYVTKLKVNVTWTKGFVAKKQGGTKEKQ